LIVFRFVYNFYHVNFKGLYGRISLRIYILFNILYIPICFIIETGDVTYQTVLNKNTKGFQFGELSFVLKIDPNPIVLIFASEQGLSTTYFYKFSRKLCLYYATLEEINDEGSSIRFFSNFILLLSILFVKNILSNFLKLKSC